MLSREGTGMEASSGIPAGAEVRLDDENLPVWVSFPAGTPPAEYEVVFVTGYGYALGARATEMFAQGGWEAFHSLPTRRQDVERFLSARTWDEYMDMIETMFGGAFRAESGFRDAQGTPAVLLIADYGTLSTVEISTEWAVSVGPAVVANELVTCANEIRRQRIERRTESKYEHLDDQQLEVRLQEHLESLLIQRSA